MANELAAFRRRHLLTQEQAAAAVAVSLSTWCQLERGYRGRRPTASLLRLLEALDRLRRHGIPWPERGGGAGMGRITKGDREELRRILGQRTKVAKAKVEECGKAMVAEFERQMATIYEQEDEASATSPRPPTPPSRRRTGLWPSAARSWASRPGPGPASTWLVRPRHELLPERRAELRRVCLTQVEAQKRPRTPHLEEAELQGRMMLVRPTASRARRPTTFLADAARAGGADAAHATGRRSASGRGALRRRRRGCWRACGRPTRRPCSSRRNRRRRPEGRQTRCGRVTHGDVKAALRDARGILDRALPLPAGRGPPRTTQTA